MVSDMKAGPVLDCALGGVGREKAIQLSKRQEKEGRCWNASFKDDSALHLHTGEKQPCIAQRHAAPGQMGVLSSILVWAAGLQHGRPLSKVPK